jgi:hypothetical protein
MGRNKNNFKILKPAHPNIEFEMLSSVQENPRAVQTGAAACCLPSATRGAFLKNRPPTFRDPPKNFCLEKNLKDAKLRIAE